MKKKENSNFNWIWTFKDIPRETSEAHATKIFEDLDVDGNGTLDEEEFVKVTLICNLTFLLLSRKKQLFTKLFEMQMFSGLPDWSWLQ